MKIAPRDALAPSPVVLDACVLFPAALRDTLLRASTAGLIRPRWSEDILAELGRSLVENDRVNEQQAQRLVVTMREYFPGALVEGYRALEAGLTNDPKDRYVLATVIVTGARTIVTANLRHFPSSALDPFDIQAQSPDELLLDLLEKHRNIMERVLREQAADLRNPPLSVQQVLAEIARDAPGFATAVVL